MKTAILSDTHFGIKNDSPVFFPYFKRFLDEVFFPRLEAENIKEVIHPGDVFDRRKYINFNTLNSAKEMFFDKLKSMGIRMRVSAGNHDTYYKNTNTVNSPSLLLSDYDNITVYTDPVELDGILWLPWICADNEQETYRMIAAADARIVVGHLSVAGCIMHKGAVCDDGLESDLFSKFKTVITGHFHTKNDYKNIHYVGCPWDLIFTDADEDKGFHIFNTETHELEFVVNPFKIFNKLYYNDAGKTTDDNIYYPNWIYENLTGTYVKVFIQHKQNPFLFEKYQERISECNPASVIYVETPPEVLSEENSISLADDTLTIFKTALNDFSEVIQTDEQRIQMEKLITDLYMKALNV